MASVSVNPPKTPVTKGSSGIAAATVPNVCKMPGPPAPFVPTPLPNIGKSGDSPKGYSKKVKVEKQPVAIRGASFKSMGDVASKGLGGGLVSVNTHGPTKFVGPGAFDVKIEGKNTQLLADAMLNNCGASGSPPNASATAIVQSPKATLSSEDKGIICESFCECQALYDAGRISGRGCCSTCLQKKIDRRAPPHIMSEQSFLLPGDKGPPQLLTPQVFREACEPLQGTRAINFVSGLLRGDLRSPVGPSVSASKAVRLSRGLNALKKTLTAANIPNVLGRIVRPDIVVQTSGGLLVLDAKFSWKGGRKDAWRAGQREAYENIGAVTMIDKEECEC